MNEHKTQDEEFEAVGVVVGCLVELDDKYLLVQEAQPHVYGLWNIPAGHVDKGESLEVAAVREAEEESGYKVELLKEVALIHETAPQSIKHIFKARVLGGKLTPQDGEILDARWFTVEEIIDLNKQSKLRKPWVWDVIRNDHTTE